MRNDDGRHPTWCFVFNPIRTTTTTTIPAKQAHFHGSPPSDSKASFTFQLLGCLFLFSSLSKLTTVFLQAEGTYLRQKLLLLWGTLDLLTAYVAYSYGGLGEDWGDAMGGFVALHAAEGAAFVGDAVGRERPPAKRKAK